jgi:MraZ protein
MVDKMFMGSALCAVDSEGAIILPPFILEPLALRSNSSSILLGGHETDTCLVGYDPPKAAQLQEECRRRRIAEETSKPSAWHARARRLFGLLHTIPVGKGGRIVLPDLLRRRARISEAVLVVGTGEAFEIWGLNVALYGHDASMRSLASLSLEISKAA